jgi:hypothetical protein
MLERDDAKPDFGPHKYQNRTNERLYNLVLVRPQHLRGKLLCR